MTRSPEREMSAQHRALMPAPMRLLAMEAGDLCTHQAHLPCHSNSNTPRQEPHTALPKRHKALHHNMNSHYPPHPNVSKLT